MGGGDVWGQSLWRVMRHDARARRGCAGRGGRARGGSLRRSAARRCSDAVAVPAVAVGGWHRRVCGSGRVTEHTLNGGPRSDARWRVWAGAWMGMVMACGVGRGHPAVCALALGVTDVTPGVEGDATTCGWPGGDGAEGAWWCGGGCGRVVVMAGREQRCRSAGVARGGCVTGGGGGSHDATGALGIALVTRVVWAVCLWT